MKISYQKKYSQPPYNSNSYPNRIGKLGEHIAKYIIGKYFNPKYIYRNFKDGNFELDYVVETELDTVILEVKSGNTKLDKLKERISEQKLNRITMVNINPEQPHKYKGLFIHLDPKQKYCQFTIEPLSVF